MGCFRVKGIPEYWIYDVLVQSRASIEVVHGKQPSRSGEGSCIERASN